MDKHFAEPIAPCAPKRQESILEESVQSLKKEVIMLNELAESISIAIGIDMDSAKLQTEGTRPIPALSEHLREICSDAQRAKNKLEDSLKCLREQLGELKLVNPLSF